MKRWPLICLVFSHSLLAVETTQKQIGVKVSPLGAEGLLSTAGGLLLILALIIGGAWLFKRYAQLPMTGKGLVRVLGGTSVGARERVVVVEVENTRLLLGVAPGQVRTLHVLAEARENFRDRLNAARGGGESLNDQREVRQ
ncbi:MAG: flagellar biosynthetic protein FliO [Candidatus Thiodiazotropha sp. (ex Dulcina madagascariensis)]|nr:flagellar biosynthetic protein FliO [Candidatus Thiodiazotropha sp. (ex Dulcina madagascariensis)]MCU7925448.1 flagellar biosynthetic protein FliO [Candidatus Thiodiazotropha sp. (ex Dulcina madagascariensis)]